MKGLKEFVTLKGDFNGQIVSAVKKVQNLLQEEIDEIQDHVYKSMCE